MAVIDDILGKMPGMLYPIGRSFLQVAGNLKKLHKVISDQLATIYNDANNVIDAMNPTSSAFTADDATMWEEILGIISKGAAVPLADRKAAILQKMRFPGDRRCRLTREYLEDQLRLAGFDVRVYENRFPSGGTFITKTPAEVLGIPMGRAVYGSFNYGQLNYGSSYALYGVSIIANYIEEAKDAVFSVSNYRERKEEFRQLILQLKAANLIGFMFVTYV